MGKYVPNLTATTFELSREYVREVGELTGSETLRRMLDEVCGILCINLGKARCANFWGSGVILRRKKVVRRRYRMLGYSGSLEWYGWMLLCSWVVLKWNKKASFGFIDFIVFMLLLLLCKLE